MLAQLEKPTNDFYALTRYLIQGRSQPPHPDRVDWIIAHNLPTDDPELAAKIMTATAERSKRCKRACLHAIIAWRDDERPTPEIMQDIARRTLELAGLGEHQAFIVGHGDKQHPHLHMAINRVSPVDGKAWDMYRSHQRFDAIMRQLSDEYGFQYVPAHAFAPEQEVDHLDKLPNSNARYAAKRGASTTRRQWSADTRRKLTDSLNDTLTAGSTWEDLHKAVAEQGLTLEAKGKGHVIGNADGYAKLSGLGLNITARPPGKKVVRRPPRKPQPGKQRGPSRPIWAVDAVDIARAIGSRDDVRKAVNDAQARQLARIAKLPLIDQLMAELMREWRGSTGLRRSRSRAMEQSVPAIGRER